MEGLLLMAMLVQSAFCWLFMKNLLAQVQAKHSEEGTRLALLARDAIETIAAKSIQEKVRADAVRKEYDVRLELYKDAVVKETVVKKKTQPTDPQYVLTDDGQKIDPNDVDWMSD